MFFEGGLAGGIEADVLDTTVLKMSNWSPVKDVLFGGWGMLVVGWESCSKLHRSSFFVGFLDAEGGRIVDCTVCLGSDPKLKKSN